MSRNAIIALLVLGVVGTMTASADQVVSDQSDAGRERKRPAIVVPFAFSTEALQTGVGAVYFRKGILKSPTTASHRNWTPSTQ